MILRKGTSIINLRAFVLERFGVDAWSDLLAALPEFDREILILVRSAQWYDIKLHERLNKAFCERLYAGNVARMQELGRFSADRDFLTRQRWVLRFTKPTLALRCINAYWREEETSGSWTVESIGEEIIAQLSGWETHEPTLCQRLLGYMGRVFELGGPLASLSHPRCCAYGDPVCEFRFRWHTVVDVPVPEPILSPEDLYRAASELAIFARCADTNLLADAILTVVRTNFSCVYACLSLAPIGAGETDRHYAVGAREGEPLREFALVSAGRMVGVLQIEQAPGALRDDALLDKLIHCFSDALDVAGRPLHHSMTLEERIEAAAKQWNLNEKECSILREIVSGAVNKQIEAALNLGKSTVEGYVASVCRKALVQNRVALAIKFFTDLSP